MGRRRLFLAGLAVVLLLAACGPAADPGNPVQTAMSATLTARPLVSPTTPPSPEPGEAGDPVGKIVYVCQYSQRSGRNQLCLINADGSGQRVLTPGGDYDDFFPSITPDGRVVLFASSRNGAYRIYEYDLVSDQVRQLVQVANHRLYAPTASPDNAYIVFYAERAGHSYPQSHNLWIAARDGSNPTQITQRSGGAWDPVWSPDGTQILFASEVNGAPQLFVVNADGSAARQVTNFIGVRGRNDWSRDGLLSTYIGAPWDRDIYTFDLNGENLRQLTDGFNNLAPSFSPDGQWITFMSYRDHPRQDLGCEIYIMRTDGSDAGRLTDNNICDWQPRWGP